VLHPLAGQPAPSSILVNVSRLVTTYYTERPAFDVANQRVRFGTSGHRGSSLDRSFNEAHILAITQAVCDYRRAEGIDGPIFLAMDTHALSEPAWRTTLEVLGGNRVPVYIEASRGYTPTPSLSRAIIEFNRGKTSGLADGIVLTPSHNPPEDGGFKYNPPHGGPAGSDATAKIEARANHFIATGLTEIQRVPFATAIAADTTMDYDFVTPYVRALSTVLDLPLVRASGLRIGIDALGGAGVAYWGPIAETYGLDIEVVHDAVDARFAFMTVDHDGKIRMDCSSPSAMAGLVALRDKYDIAFGNDTDYDRHGIVTPSAGLMNPNHYLSVAIDYLFRERTRWSKDAGIGKTLVSSSMIDRVAGRLGRRLVEVPVGFKWFVQGLATGSLGFGGEESAGASFLNQDGQVWATEKDGILLGLLAAEITARRERDPSEEYRGLVEEFGEPYYRRTDAPATAEQRAVLLRLSPDSISQPMLAGDPIVAKTTEVGGAAIGGLKVASEHAWFAARPSGTENIYKIYAESFRGENHLGQVESEARSMIEQAFGA